MKYLNAAFLLLAVTFTLAACDPREPNADQKQTQETKRLTNAANEMIGMPNIVNFTEKRFMRMIYELKDQEVSTYTYVLDMQGELHFLCDSVGYGVSASTQFSNPQRPAGSTSGGYYALPQPEPNGLFMPEGLSATYVLCSDGAGGTRPVYLEPEIIVSPFKLTSATSLQ